MRRIDEKKSKLDEINNAIKYRYRFSMYQSARYGTTEKKALLRKFFCKYMMEHGVTGKLVSEYIGWDKLTLASTLRLELSRQFKTDEKVLEEWHKFNKYLINQKTEHEQHSPVK
jgi:hypothetical protein